MKVSELLYPRLSGVQMAFLARHALYGAVIASIYGSIHDQITYTLSPEYFAAVKFPQFSYVDFGGPKRLFVAEIGILATCWVGFFCLWFVGRILIRKVEPAAVAKGMCRAAWFVTVCALAGGVIGAFVALTMDGFLIEHIWFTTIADLGIQDTAMFSLVACIHYGGYIAALLGTLWAIRTACGSRDSI